MADKFSLQNDHNVYILGAGFSAEYGLPLISNFMQTMRDAHSWLMAQGRTGEAQAIGSVLAFRLDSASAAYRVNLNLENIEELFSLASAIDLGLTSKIQLAIAATLDYAQCSASKDYFKIAVDRSPRLPSVWSETEFQNFNSEEVCGRIVERYQLYVAHMADLLNSNPRSKNTFISFNYDTVVEEKLAELSIPYSYDFLPRTVEYGETATCLRTETGDATSVLKLHGSVNWTLPGKRGKRLAIHRSYDQVRAQGLSPHLVPPTWNKRFDGQLNQVWKKGVAALNTATRIIVIGFSMPPTDIHFKYLLAAGLQNNVSLRTITFCDPAAEAVEARVVDILRGGGLPGQPIRVERLRTNQIFASKQYSPVLGRKNDIKVHDMIWHQTLPT